MNIIKLIVKNLISFVGKHLKVGISKKKVIQKRTANKNALPHSQLPHYRCHHKHLTKRIPLSSAMVRL